MKSLGFFTSSYSDGNLNGHRYGKLINATVLELITVKVPWWFDLAEAPHFIDTPLYLR